MSIESDYDVLDYEAGVSDEVLGQECCSCFRLLRWKFFDRNSAYRNGYELQCSWCKKQPALSIAEHTARLQELNFNSEGTRRQRHSDQDELHRDRTGRMMDCSLFLQKLLHVYPALYVTQGGVRGDLALYATSGTNRPEWGGNSFKYIGYATLGIMPEFSKYEFDEQQDILLRVTNIGWRSILLRFIENNVLTEAQCDQEFGPPSGGANSIWYKKLHNHRNSKKI
jgi:hypothetical protein